MKCADGALDPVPVRAGTQLRLQVPYLELAKREEADSSCACRAALKAAQKVRGFPRTHSLGEH